MANSPTVAMHGVTSIVGHAKKFNTFNLISFQIKQGDDIVAYIECYTNSPDQKLEVTWLEPMDLTYPTEATE